jgi:hypothetical protein
MSYFDDASLVMIPSGYKTSKVYSVKPTDGTGDLTFSRSNDTATRVGPDGLIEKVRTNLILQSQAFNTTWTTGSVSITANTTANPLNGAVNADTITLTGATIQKYVIQAFAFNGVYTVSVYLKAGTHQFVQLMLGTDATPFANFDLVNGTASATGSTATIVSAGSGFFRCSMSFASTTGTDVFITAADSLATTRYQSTASTGTFIAFGCQVETGDIATAYIATTTAAVSVGPVANVPRLDYLNSSCPRLLLEPQRQNVMTFSESIDNAAWTKRNATITANAVVSPDGYTNADKLAEDSSTSVHDFYQYFLATSGVSYTMSFFAKAAERTFCTIQFSSTGLPAGNTFFNLQTGAVVSSPAGITASMVPYGNGWYRCIMSATATSTEAAYFVYANALNGTTTNYAGTTGSGTYIWGAQVEAGAYATSYIPTLGASVTRGADAASKTGISSLIGQTEGTLFVEFDFNGNYDVNGIVTIDVLGAGGNEAYIFMTGGGQLRLELYVASAIQGLILSSIGAVGRKKIAFAYKANDFVGYMNGVQVGTDTSGTVGSMDTIYVGTYQTTTYAAGNINQALLFKTRLTNAQLAELTTI